MHDVETAERDVLVPEPLAAEVDAPEILRSAPETSGGEVAVPGRTFSAPALIVGHANDPAEADADRVAEAALAHLAEVDPRHHAPALARSARRSAAGPIGLEGGAVDVDTEQAITSRLGRGGRMSTEVRHDMETAFGRSFGGVNIHTGAEADTLNRQMSATAFTVGTDIFFSQGAYQPDSAGGRRLLAHELAHVAQNGGAARRTIHRAVGFEFETNVTAHAIDDAEAGTTKALAKMYVIKKYDEGFRMEADENTTLGSTIEFVVDPAVEENDRGKLVAIMKKMTEVAGKLQSDADTDQKKPATTLHEIEGTDVSDTSVVIAPRKNVTANPQVTGGVQFGKVTTVMSEMGAAASTKKNLTAKEKSAASELDQYESLRKKVVDRANSIGGVFKAKKPSNRLRDLGALMALYVAVGEGPKPSKGDELSEFDIKGKPPLNYAKLISGSILVRTDFASLFKRLPSKERLALEKDPQELVDWIVTIADLPPSAGNGLLFERGVYKYNAPRTGEGKNVELADDAVLQITRKEWITGVVGGSDRLSSKTFGADKPTLEGLGGLGKKFDEVGDQVGKGGRRSGVVMEFRQMKQNRPIGDWNDLALNIFDYLSGVSAR